MIGKNVPKDMNPGKGCMNACIFYVFSLVILLSIIILLAKFFGV